MVSCLSFKVWTHGFDKRDLRELPSSFLKRKESKVRGENSDFAWTGGNGEASWMFVLRKVKEEVRWSLVIAWPAKCLVFGFKSVNMQETLALHVLNFNWLHVGGISTTKSHASYA